jgi:hypothetical protein
MLSWLGLLAGVVVSLLGLGSMAWAGRTLWDRSRRRRRVEDRWAQLGGRLGLRYRGPKMTTAGVVARRFGGPLAGREVVLTLLPRPSAQDWTLRLELLRSNLPRELVLEGPYLELLGVEVLRLRPGLPEQRDLGLDRRPGHGGPYLGPTLTVHGGRHLELELTSVQEGEEVATLAAAQELLSQLEASIDRGWIEAGRSLGLHAGLSVDGQPPELSGQLEGRELRARVHRGSPAWRLGEGRSMEPQTWTEVVTRWQNPRLSDLEVALPEALPDQPQLDVPVLDMLVAVRCRDRQAAREVLGRPELAEVLLAVVHGHPGSQVLPGQVRLRTRGEPGPQTRQLLLDAARLARLLSED